MKRKIAYRALCCSCSLVDSSAAPCHRTRFDMAPHLDLGPRYEAPARPDTRISVRVTLEHGALANPLALALLLLLFLICSRLACDPASWPRPGTRAASRELEVIFHLGAGLVRSPVPGRRLHLAARLKCSRRHSTNAKFGARESSR